MAATATDPAYYVTNNILVVVPTPTNSQNAHVQTLNYPSVAFGDSAIAKFPDDAEYLVVIYACIKAIESAFTSEEDVELYTPILAQLRSDYEKGLQGLL